jgi:Bacterial PH domain
MIGKILLDIDRALFWACIAYVVADMFGWVRVDRGAKELPGNRVKFGPNWTGFACLGVIVTMIPATVRMFWHLRWGLLDLVMPVGMSILLVGFLLELPGTITVSDQGLKQQYWFGRNKRIGWSDIAEIHSGPKDRSIAVTGTDGTRIGHSFFHSGRGRLLKELKQHCGSELPEDFPREPLETI